MIGAIEGSWLVGVKAGDGTRAGGVGNTMGTEALVGSRPRGPTTWTLFLRLCSH